MKFDVDIETYKHNKMVMSNLSSLYCIVNRGEMEDAAISDCNK